jgi:thiamine biosynthesis lipoprotein
MKDTHLHARIEVMGTTITVDGYATQPIDAKWWDQKLSLVAADLQWVDETFSTWKADSAVSKWRRAEKSLDELPHELASVIQRCQELTALSKGWFDPWACPDGFDPSGFVKGWAAERAVLILRDGPLDGAIVNAAGDVALFGQLPAGETFRVGIVDPFDRGQLVRVVEVTHALATSGEGERGQHLVNPFTGVYEASMASASVTGPDMGTADALATALAIGGEEVLVVINDIPEYEAFMIGFNGRHWGTPGFPFAAL